MHPISSTITTLLAAGAALTTAFPISTTTEVVNEERSNSSANTTFLPRSDKPALCAEGNDEGPYQAWYIFLPNDIGTVNPYDADECGKSIIDNVS
ncbi:hypothetical protein F5B20DRAFT_548804, partial [Whalleya microplaca]